MRMAIVGGLALVTCIGLGFWLGSTNKNDSSPAPVDALERGMSTRRSSEPASKPIETTPLKADQKTHEPTEAELKAAKRQAFLTTLMREFDLGMDRDSLLRADIDDDEIAQLRKARDKIDIMRALHMQKYHPLTREIVKEMRASGQYELMENEKARTIKKIGGFDAKVVGQPKRHTREQIIVQSLTFDEKLGRQVRQLFRINPGRSQELDDLRREQLQEEDREVDEIRRLIAVFSSN